MNPTPVLLFCFNRPDFLELQLERLIFHQQHRMLYIAIDGPRMNNEDDVRKQQKIKGIIRKYCNGQNCILIENKINKGCGKQISSTITSVFGLGISKLIILEDDCLPLPGYFEYMDCMLDKYEDQKDIQSINGSMFLKNLKIEKPYSTKYFHVWGWGTWRKKWVEPNLYRKIKFTQLYFDYRTAGRFSCLESIRLAKHTQKAYINKIDTWDYQLLHQNVLAQKYAMAPVQSLVNNIGINNGTNRMSDPDFDVSSVSFLGLHRIFTKNPDLLEDIINQIRFICNISQIRKYIK